MVSACFQALNKLSSHVSPALSPSTASTLSPVSPPSIPLSESNKSSQFKNNRLENLKGISEKNTQGQGTATVGAGETGTTRSRGSSGVEKTGKVLH